MMRVDVIEGLENFAALRENWEKVYAADPEAQFFLSWTWLSQWLDYHPKDWFILAARPDRKNADYVAFFPLRTYLKSRKQTGFYNEIGLAGRAMSDYAGLITRPDCAGPAIDAFGHHLRRARWAAFNMQCIRISETRLEMLMRHFPKSKFAIHRRDNINKADNVDNLICPAIALPDDYDEYLATLGTNTRQKMRRFLRKVENSDEYSVSFATAETFEQDLLTTLGFWAIKWKERKSQYINNLLRNNFTMLRQAFDNGAVLMPVMRAGGAPVAALVSFLDPAHRSVLFFLTGRNEEFRGPPPGIVLHAYSIRWAIENGYRTYDFLRGNEEYKYMFGVEEHRIQHLIVSTRTGTNIGDKLDSRFIPAVLKRTAALHKAGRLAAAEIGYRQLLATDPHLPAALYGLGQLQAQKGKHGAAAQCFRTLVKVNPKSDKAWLRLGAALEAGKKLSAAADAYRKVTEARPDSRAAHMKLGQALMKLGRTADADTAFTVARTLQPKAKQVLSTAVAGQARPH